MKDKSLILNSIFEGILERKGKEIVSLSFEKIPNAYYDSFVICHANPNTQVNAIADNIEKKVKEDLNINVHHREGIENAYWVLLDFADVIVHIFQKEYRDFYNIESLWGDATINRIEESFE